MTRWFILADDLTGAADCAIAFGRRGLASAVTWRDPAAIAPDAQVLSYDADSRGLAADAAARHHTGILQRLLDGDRRLFKKIDSTLRGQPAAETAAIMALLTARRGTAFGILAPAFPATGRTTVAAHIHVDGRPLEHAEVWRRDHTYASADLTAVLSSAGVQSEAIPLATVRGPGLAAALARIAAQGETVAICDATTDDDLARIAAAGLSGAIPAFFIGSAGLAHALAAVEPAGPTAAIRLSPNGCGSLIVVGSLASASRAAARKIVDDGHSVHVPVQPDVLLGPDAGKTAFAARVAAIVAAGDDALVEIVMDGAPEMALAQRLVTSLAAALAPVAPQLGAIAATGGETAAALLAGFGVSGIRMVDEIEPGISLGLTLGRLSIPVVTKAGAFGDAMSLIRIGARLRTIRTKGSFA